MKIPQDDVTGERLEATAMQRLAALRDLLWELVEGGRDRYRHARDNGDDEDAEAASDNLRGVIDDYLALF